MTIIVSTTGTTGTPKRIELSKEILQARSDLTTIAKGKNIADCKVIHVGMSEKSSAFARFKEWGEQTGKKIIGIIPLNEMVDTIRRENVDAINAAPAYLVRIAQLFEATGQSANLKQVISGHATMNRKDAVYIQKWLGKDLQVGYGCTEIGTVCTGTAEEIADTQGCVGFPISGIQVEIVDGNVIRIKSESTMVTEYIDNPQKTSEHFRDGWFYPGDKGYFTKDGRLVITKNR
jgi:long-subunit acyl-CoA synthetase (AMP-forming)